jgi:hypothetical protein
MRGFLRAGALVLCSGLPGLAGEVSNAVVTLEVIEPAADWREAGAAPMRFALLDKGRVYVGGSARLATGVLEDRERKELEKRVERLAKQKGGLSATEPRGPGGELRLGPGETRHRLQLPKRGVVFLAAGAPEGASGELRLLGELIEQLRDFDHHSLVEWTPLEFLLSVTRRTLPGGCRPWRMELDPESLLRRPVTIPSGAAPDWPTGAVPTSACLGDQRFAVTLRPLVPGES